MIPIDKNSEKAQPAWQEGFLKILPEVQRRLTHAFCRLDPEARDDATEDAIVHCLLAYIRLFDQRRLQTIARRISLGMPCCRCDRAGRPHAA